MRKSLNFIKELLLYFTLGSNHWWLGDSGVTQEPAQWTDVSHLFGYVKKHHDDKRVFASFLCWLYHYSPQERVWKCHYREKGFHFRWKYDQENPVNLGCWWVRVMCLCTARFWMGSTPFVFHSLVFSHLWQTRSGLKKHSSLTETTYAEVQIISLVYLNYKFIFSQKAIEFRSNQQQLSQWFTYLFLSSEGTLNLLCLWKFWWVVRKNTLVIREKQENCPQDSPHFHYWGLFLLQGKKEAIQT